MRFAALETSTEACSVALWVDGDALGAEERQPNRHSELVLPMLEQLLAQAGIAISDLDAVAFGAGPGAFTGLRIACGVAQGIAFARDLPVLGVSTMEAIAEESGAARVAAAVDARMKQVYFAALEKRDGRWQETSPVRCVDPTEAMLPGGGPWVGCGSGFAAYPGLLAGRLAAVRPEVGPTAIAVAMLAAPRLARGEGVDAALAAPIYVREKVAFTQAELRAR